MNPYATHFFGLPAFILNVRSILLFAILAVGIPPATAQEWRPSLTNRTFNDTFILNSMVGWAVGDGGIIARTLDGGLTWRFQISGTTTNLKGVWAASASEAWAVGLGGLILRWDGSSWTSYDSGTTADFNAVFGTVANDVWAVGGGATIKRWNGSAWVAQSGQGSTIYSVWGTSSNDMWIGGSSGVSRWNGTAWGTLFSSNVRSIHGVDAGNIWAVGTAGSAWRWNGASWTAQTTGTTSTLNKVWAADSGNVWAVGGSGLVLKWNGTGWQTQSSGVSLTLNSLSGTSANNLYCAASTGTILHWNGSYWEKQIEGPTSSIREIFVVSPTAGYAITDGYELWRWNGQRWMRIGNFSSQPTGIWAADANTAFVSLNPGYIQMWDGDDLLPIGASGAFSSVSGSSSSDVWAPSSTTGVFRWNGSAMNNTGGGSVADTVHVVDSSNVWVVGFSGKIVKWNGTSWQEQVSNTSAHLYDVFALDSTTAWTVGQSGVVRRWNGTSWASQNIPTSVSVCGVWAMDTNNVWIVGDSGTIFKWNGSSWVAQSSGVSHIIISISGTAADNLWAAGGNTILTTQPEAGPVPDITVTENDAVVDDGGSASVFAVTAMGEDSVKTFALANTGSDTVTNIAVAKNGSGAGDFVVSGVQSATLAPGATTTFTVAFTASTAVSNAALQISSNVPGSKSSYEINLTGQILSEVADSDGDGMNDAAELKLQSLGFDWQTAQQALVSSFYSHAGIANLYTSSEFIANRTAGQNDVLNSPNSFNLFSPSQIQAMNVGVPLIEKNSVTGEFTVSFGLEKSTDLTSFSPFPVTSPQATVNEQGRVELRFTVPDNTAFFRIQSQ